ncbi:DUF3243 domain-containing protein [Paenibacillus turpanensis]|uniref:DUF3243 domain-containing protein n=1 Tax=Paenibacillus turpanensis TaxID=2689078 RepID=UPI001408FCD9|nr:DUF3243 domain-containing protein [Paenibacillus turpanensis]
MTTVLTYWDKWKEFLGERVQNAKQTGMNEEVITNLAKEIGDFLAKKVDPKNDEERVLQELWNVADEQEKKTIAHLMFKLAEKNA